MTRPQPTFQSLTPEAACAASFLASRRGVPADERWCGRTLAEDLSWVRNALDHVALSA